MVGPSENTSLLGRAISSNPRGANPYAAEDASTENDSDEDAIEDVDEPVDILIARYGSPVGSLGLSGGIGAFGNSFSRPGRRASVAFSSASLSRVPSRANTFVGRRPSQPTLRSPISSKSRKPSIPKLQKKVSITTVGEDDALPVDQDADNLDQDEADEKDGEFLSGVTKSQFWGCFLAILLTWFVATFDSTLMASSHPVITSYFDASNSASWLSTSFLLTSTAFQPMFGRLSDVFGRKMPFQLCLLAFGIGTAWCAAAGSIIQFILARAVCGVGAGGTMAMGSIIIGDLVPLHRRGAYMALLNLSYGVGSSLGAALGGLLADALGWRWEFGVQVPALVVCFIVAAVTLPAELGPCLAKNNAETLWDTLKTFDLSGSVLLTGSVTFLILALNLGGNVLPWDHPFIIVSFILFGVLGLLLIKVERDTELPIMPLHLLYQIPRGNLIFSNSFACMTMNTILFNLPLYFQATLLDTPTRSGTRLIVPFLFNMLSAFITGNLISYTLRLTPTMLTGYTLIVLGSIFLTLMPRSLPTWAYSWLIATATSGQGFSFPTLSIGILAVTHPDDMAVATSTLILFRSLGTVMGVAVSSLVSQNALYYYLDQMVVGEDKDSVIAEVRRNVEIISKLQPFYREQVIDAYAAAMKVTFGQGIVTAAIALLLVIWIRMPRLSTTPTNVHVGE